MKVSVQVLGGEMTVLDLDPGTTVDAVREELGVEGYTATINGEPADGDFELAEYEFVTLSPSVKGG